MNKYQTLAIGLFLFFGCKIIGHSAPIGNLGGSAGIGDAALTSTQTFSGQNTFDGLVTISTSLHITTLDCTSNTNGGALTTDANGVVSCSDDDSNVGDVVLNATQTFTGINTFDQGIIVNESGGTEDTRIESSTNTHMLFVDVSLSDVFIGAATDDGTGPFHVIESRNGETGISITNNNVGSSARALLSFNTTFGEAATIYTVPPAFPDATGGKELALNFSAKENHYFRNRVLSTSTVILSEGGIHLEQFGTEPTIPITGTVIYSSRNITLNDLHVKNENGDITILSGAASFPLGVTITGSTLSINSVAYQFPSADGSANEVLHTDGNGNLSWDTDDTGTGFASLTSTQTFSGQNTFEAVVTISTDTDIGGGTLEIPNGANPTLEVTGELGYDTTDGTLQIHDGTAERVIAHDIFQVNFNVADDGDWTNERVPIWQAPRDMAVTIVEVRAAAMGSSTPTLDYNIQERAEGSINSEGTNIYTSTVTADGDGDNQTSFDNAAIAAGAYLIFSTTGTAQGGTVDFLVGTVYYRKDVE